MSHKMLNTLKLKIHDRGFDGVEFDLVVVCSFFFLSAFDGM